MLPVGSVQQCQNFETGQVIKLQLLRADVSRYYFASVDEPILPFVKFATVARDNPQGVVMRFPVAAIAVAFGVTFTTASAEATTLTGNMTADEGFSAYISTDPNTLGTQIAGPTSGAFSWPTAQSINTTLTAGQTNYLEPIQEVWIQRQRFDLVKRRSMMRTIARRIKAATVLA